MPTLQNFTHTALAVGLAFIVGACDVLPNSPRLGMVVDEDTGLMFGSAIQGNLVTDASFYSNKLIKVRTRNTSGDEAFDLHTFTTALNSAYETKGYTPSMEDGFGLMIDINVVYSGQVQSNQARQFGVVGALLGATYGGHSDRGLLVATTSGAALGHIIGQYATEDTYMVVADITFGVVKKLKVSRRRVTFSRSTKVTNVDDPLEDDKVMAAGFKKSFSTQFTVYAGGRNISQSEIAEQVRERAVRIAADFI
ncbi:complement resistance protein TraT [Pseudomonadota bacterium]